MVQKDAEKVAGDRGGGKERGKTRNSPTSRADGRQTTLFQTAETATQSVSDPRHAPIRTVIQELYLEKFRVRCQWDGSEGTALSRLLKANPSWSPEDIGRMVRNRFESDESSSRPRTWIPRLDDYLAGPLDRYNRPKASEVDDRVSPAVARARSNQQVITHGGLSGTALGVKLLEAADASQCEITDITVEFWTRMVWKKYPEDLIARAFDLYWEGGATYFPKPGEIITIIKKIEPFEDIGQKARRLDEEARARQEATMRQRQNQENVTGTRA